MYGVPVLCQVEDHATQEKITVDRQEVWDEVRSYVYMKGKGPGRRKFGSEFWLISTRFSVTGDELAVHCASHENQDRGPAAYLSVIGKQQVLERSVNDHTPRFHGRCS